MPLSAQAITGPGNLTRSLIRPPSCKRSNSLVIDAASQTAPSTSSAQPLPFLNEQNPATRSRQGVAQRLQPFQGSLTARLLSF